MKTISCSPSSRTRRFAGARARAFTLVELLVVIAIIGILAAMLLPVLSVAQQHAKKTQAKLECSNIANAIQQYEADYSRFPVSSAVQSSGYSDFTYGGTFQTPAGAYQVGTTNNGQIYTNSDVIAILLDETNYLNNYNGGSWTANTNYMKNPKKNIYLSNTHFSGYDPVSQPGTLPQPGIGNDLVYRDPWGNPYVITMDLDEDNLASDVFYGTTAVATTSDTAGAAGLVGLSYHSVGLGYCYHGNVMVWSAGPDGKIDPNTGGAGANAISGANKDNVLSWQ